MKFERHLFVSESILPPSSEWTEETPDWRVVRVSKGAAYWLGEATPRELQEGEVIVAAPGSKGCLRASQLGEVKLHSFHFSPELLSGVLSLSERHYFQSISAQAGSATRFLPASHPAAQEFASLVAQPSSANTLPYRCQLIHLVALVFAEEIARHQPPVAKSAAAQSRFKELINEMPEADLMKYIPEQLARMCGCSLRHFSRLFRHHFGVSIRAKQTELRLLKARQLLTDTDAKIIHVALESGYRHLGLFNSMFKKYLGMTPSEFRHKSLKKPRPHKIGHAAGILMAASCCLFTLGVNAAPMQFAVNYATGASTNPPPPKSTNTLTFPVEGYEITGTTLFKYADLEPIFKKYVGPAVGVDSILQAAAEFQMAYRNRGFVSAQVIVPKQDLTNGLVKIKVLEGRLKEINVVNNRHFSSNNIMRALPSLQTNILLNSLVFQPELDRANANRDRQIYPVIGPGPDPGTTSLNLKVKDRLPLHGRVDFNNYSTPETPELRVNSSAQYNNLWQLEHQIGVQYGFSPEEFKAGTPAPSFYDLPLVANYSAFYRMPLDYGKAKDRGRPLGLSNFGYDEATKKFRAPPAAEFADLTLYASRSFSDTGPLLQSRTVTQPPDFDTAGGLQITDDVYSQTLTKNEGLGFRMSDPLPEVWNLHNSVSFGLDYKSYRSETVQREQFTAIIVNPSVGDTGPPFDPPIPASSPPPTERKFATSVQYLPASAGWEVAKQDQWGSTSLNLNGSFNLSAIFDNEEDFRRVAASRHANGNYIILTPGITREQKLVGDWALRLHADGQWANQPLISNEQFGLGGLSGPRGYRDGQEYGDTGWRVLIEPHTPLFKVALGEQGTLPTFMRLSLFTDYGERYLLDPPPSRPRSLAMWSAGFGISATRGEHFDVRLTFGIPLLDAGAHREASGLMVGGVHAWNPRLAFSVSAQF